MTKPASPASGVTVPVAGRISVAMVTQSSCPEAGALVRVLMSMASAPTPTSRTAPAAIAVAVMAEALSADVPEVHDED